MHELSCVMNIVQIASRGRGCVEPHVDIFLLSLLFTTVYNNAAVVK